MSSRNLSMKVKRSLRDNIPLLTLTYGSETWTWNRAQQSRVCAMERSYLKGACGMTRWEGEKNESVCGKRIMGPSAKGVKRGVLEWVKRNTLRWFGHMERKKSEVIVCG